jgi:hypothetical protein
MYIYIVTHPKFDGWIKLGRSIDPEKRLRDYQTNCPDNGFKLEYKIETKYYYNIETYFENFVQSNTREWFQCSVDFARNKINEILDQIIKEPDYLKKGEHFEDGILYVQKKNKRPIICYYIVDDIRFDSIRELSNYTGITVRTLYQSLNNKIELEIESFKIKKYKTNS